MAPIRERAKSARIAQRMSVMVNLPGDTWAALWDRAETQGKSLSLTAREILERELTPQREQPQPAPEPQRESPPPDDATPGGTPTTRALRRSAPKGS